MDSHNSKSDTAAAVEADTTDSLRSSDPATAEVLNSVRSLLRALRVGTRTAERSTGLSLAQLYVLKRLAEHPADSMNDLAERTATHQSSVSVVVSRLVRRGLAVRETVAEDRRRARVNITDAGRVVLATAPETISEQLVHGVEQMPAHEREMLAHLMRSWLQAAGVDLSTAPMFFE